MSWLGITPLKKFQAPITIGPFLRCRYDARASRDPIRYDPPAFRVLEALTAVPGLVILYGINSAQNAMMQSDEWKNDARNPNAKSGGH
ncbi:ATPase, F0 complex, subunit J [Nemania serpens]|nr:ATPase, F0 complex, subunit J [Nemania serpens]